jgi:uncharacterized protein
MAESQPYFQRKQAEFSAYIRDPLNSPIPDDVKKQRMQMYRELFFNNINSFLTTNFPVLREIIDEQAWQDLVQDFFSKHPCKTPYFTEIPEEFIGYLQNERSGNAADPPFMLELAHYEWVEMALSIAKDELPVKDEAFIKNPYVCRIRLSALAWPLAYEFPVQKISPVFQPTEKGELPTYLVVHRNRDLRVKFLEITALTFRLLQIIQESQVIAGQACLEKIIQEAPHLESDVLINGGMEILKNMAEQEIILRA